MSSQFNVPHQIDQTEVPRFALQHSLSAPRASVFAAWSEPTQLQAWMANGDLDVSILEFEPKAGGRFHFELRDGDGATAWGLWVFDRIEPGRQLRFTEHPSDANGNRAAGSLLSLCTEVSFTGFHGVETFIEIVSKPAPTEPQSVAEFERIKPALQQAWSATLARLELHCASRLALSSGRTVATLGR